MTEFSRVLEHLRRHAVRTDGPFTLRSGEISDWYIDARQTTFDGEGARLVGTAVAGLLPPDTTAVGGMTMGADPIAVATAIVSTQDGRPLKAFSIRKETKDHGTGGRLVGPVKTGDIVTILEDTTTSGAALVEAIRVALESGLTVNRAITLVDRSGGKAAGRVEEMGIEFRAICTPQDLGI